MIGTRYESMLPQEEGKDIDIVEREAFQWHQVKKQKPLRISSSDNVRMEIAVVPTTF